jgi:hypothetical protein
MIEQQTQRQSTRPRKTSASRVRAFRARQKVKAALAAAQAEREAKAAWKAARDAKRIAKGKLPLDEANRVKVRAYRDRKQALKVELTAMWFAPELSQEELFSQTAAANASWSKDFVQDLVDGVVRACRKAAVNVNAFSTKNGAHKANHARTVFHELAAAGVPLLDAARRSSIEPFQPNPKLSDIAQAIDTVNRFEAAQLEWGCGDELWETLAGKL